MFRALIVTWVFSHNTHQNDKVYVFDTVWQTKYQTVPFLCHKWKCHFRPLICARWGLNPFLRTKLKQESILLAWREGLQFWGIRDFKANSGEIRDWKYVQEAGYQNNPRDYGIAWNFWSGWRNWRTLLGTLWGYRMYGRRTLPSPFGNGKVTVIYRVTDIFIGQLCRKYKATDIHSDRYQYRAVIYRFDCILDKLYLQLSKAKWQICSSKG